MEGETASPDISYAAAISGFSLRWALKKCGSRRSFRSDASPGGGEGQNSDFSRDVTALRQNRRGPRRFCCKGVSWLSVSRGQLHQPGVTEPK